MRSSETVCSKNKAFSLKSTVTIKFSNTGSNISRHCNQKQNQIFVHYIPEYLQYCKYRKNTFCIFCNISLLVSTGCVFFFLKVLAAHKWQCVNNMYYITRYCDYKCVNKFIQYSQIYEQVKILDNTFVHSRNSRLGVTPC